ncbi:hypothetical protein PoB_002783300 [Plakobranchus ocellatus]|uniref:Uncharacterized protein n=1 Tax=Plakobranchus ocellatus TaxID=259542 RepID=A0AAV4A2E6_9GAST|nr:hypothetical protein PoB_002783300 [Plakobranchus ocellatus]
MTKRNPLGKDQVGAMDDTVATARAWRLKQSGTACRQHKAYYSLEHQKINHIKEQREIPLHPYYSLFVRTCSETVGIMLFWCLKQRNPRPEWFSAVTDQTYKMNN